MGWENSRLSSISQKEVQKVSKMASWKTQRKRAKIKDKKQCQICGEVLPIPYGGLEVHHIVPRSKGGSDELENLVTLCDLCHAVVTPHMGPAWVGLSKFPPEEQEQKKFILEWTREEFESFLLLPIEERRRIQDEVWPRWDIMRNQ